MTPQAVIPIQGTVKDDYGVVEVFAELARNEDDPVKLPLELSKGEELNSRVDLAQLAEANQLALAPNMTLGLVVAARDRYNLQGQQHIGLGQPQQLAVVTPDKLLVILDRQELEMRQRLELIINEVQQLREALQNTATSLSQGDSARSTKPSRSSFVSQQDPAPTSGSQDVDGNKQNGPDAQAQLRRIALLRAQQAVLQGDKSQQELSSITLRVDNIRKQLINNRIDSTDRQVRLKKKSISL